jgi:hypothetical protein
VFTKVGSHAHHLRQFVFRLKPIKALIPVALARLGAVKEAGGAATVAILTLDQVSNFPPATFATAHQFL